MGVAHFSDYRLMGVHISAALTAVIPGLNMPWWHLPLFIGVCLLAGIVHELGHALAAVHFNVPVSGFGIFLFIIYPGAFTEIDSDALRRSTAAQKMRIFGAGIWHNLVLALFGYFLFLSLPLLLSPLYSRNEGVLITKVSSESGLSGEAGLRKGYVVYAVNDCRVRSIRDWLSCVEHIKSERQSGYCVSSQDVLPHVATEVEWLANGELHCCGGNSSEMSLSHMCFQFHNSKPTMLDRSSTSGAVSNLPSLVDTLGLKQPNMHAVKQNDNADGSEVGEMSVFNDIYVGSELQYACLAARFVTGHNICNVSSHCNHKRAMEDRLLCVYPALFNDTSLLRIFTHHSSKSVLFVGHVDELLYYVELSDLVPRFFFLPLWLPFVVELFAKYLVTFSLAIALLNAVPCYGLDGHFLSSTIVDSLFSHCTPSRRRRLSTTLLYYGTFLMASNLIIAVVRLLKPYF
ncbi:unnamed protein product [Toxocara canis]|uniref:Membrane-bound transcription factor site-2 protease n=1 Tax=Toxocara canis TaxID=6265 RepID=A0A183V6B1_TOXCA|nr:unnamed protein product [Toxocara canis]